MPQENHALIIGHTGIAGGNLAAHLTSLGNWKVTGVARHASAALPGVEPIAARAPGFVREVSTFEFRQVKVGRDAVILDVDFAVIVR